MYLVRKVQKVPELLLFGKGTERENHYQVEYHPLVCFQYVYCNHIMLVCL